MTHNVLKMFLIVSFGKRLSSLGMGFGMVIENSIANVPSFSLLITDLKHGLTFSEHGVDTKSALT